MKNKQTEIDTGNNVLFIEHEFGRYTDATIFTCYVNSLSVRSSSLHLPRIRETFIETAISACKMPTKGAASDVARVAKEIGRYVDQVLTTSNK